MANKCGHMASSVIDSRSGSGYVRRRRMCDKCDERFTTYEIPELEYKKLRHREDVISLFLRKREEMAAILASLPGPSSNAE